MLIAGVSKYNLRWMLHTNFCMLNQCVSRGRCKDPRCKALLEIRQHVESCHEGNNCKIPLCATLYACQEHWDNCCRENCSNCSEMNYAMFSRFNPDQEAYQKTSAAESLQITDELRADMIIDM